MQTAPIKPMKPWFQVIDDLGDHLDWEEFFGNDNPVELDIGCGRGMFLFNSAVETPDVKYLGLEIDYREGRRAASRLLKRELPNARVIGGDCKIVLSRLMKKHSVRAAHVYYPDPWWKKRHHKRRLFTQEFADLLAEVVEYEGHVHSWSDVADLFDIIRDLMDGHPLFSTQTPPPLKQPEHDLDYQTSFDRKKRQMGLPVFRGLWQRNAETS